MARSHSEDKEERNTTGAKRTEARPGEAARDKSNGQRPCRGQVRNAAGLANSASRRGPKKEESCNMAKGHAEDKGGTQHDGPIAHRGAA